MLFLAIREGLAVQQLGYHQLIININISLSEKVDYILVSGVGQVMPG